MNGDEILARLADHHHPNTDYRCRWCDAHQEIIRLRRQVDTLEHDNEQLRRQVREALGGGRQ